MDHREQLSGARQSGDLRYSSPRSRQSAGLCSASSSRNLAPFAASTQEYRDTRVNNRGEIVEEDAVVNRDGEVVKRKTVTDRSGRCVEEAVEVDHREQLSGGRQSGDVRYSSPRSQQNAGLRVASPSRAFSAMSGPALEYRDTRVNNRGEIVEEDAVVNRGGEGVKRQSVMDQSGRCVREEVEVDHRGQLPGARRPGDLGCSDRRRLEDLGYVDPRSRQGGTASATLGGRRSLTPGRGVVESYHSEVQNSRGEIVESDVVFNQDGEVTQDRVVRRGGDVESLLPPRAGLGVSPPPRDRFIDRVLADGPAPAPAASSGRDRSSDWAGRPTVYRSKSPATAARHPPSPLLGGDPRASGYRPTSTYWDARPAYRSPEQPYRSNVDPLYRPQYSSNSVDPAFVRQTPDPYFRRSLLSGPVGTV